MDAKEAGLAMRRFRQRRGLTQDQVVDQSTVPTPQYLSALENGRHDVRNSDHFPSLVDVLGLTTDEIRELKPEIIWEERATTSGAPIPPRLEPVDIPLEIPHGLQEAIDRYSGIHPEFKVDQNLRVITSIYRYGGGTDFTPEEWLDIVMANRRWLVKP